jgi:hypothetical protein
MAETEPKPVDTVEKTTEAPAAEEETGAPNFEPLVHLEKVVVKSDEDDEDSIFKM